MPEPNFGKMTSMHFYGWKNGLKTGMYYLRSRPARDAIKFTVNMEALLKASDQGNSEELLKCLSKDLDEPEAKNLSKKHVTVMMGELENKKRKLNTLEYDSSAASSKNFDDEEERNKDSAEEVIFECINCGS